MTLEALYFLAQIVAALAIVGSLIFVGWQVRLNNHEQRLNLTHQRVAQISALNRMLAQDADLRAIVIRGSMSLSDLTPSELVALSSFLNELVAVALEFRRHHIAGAVDEEMVETMRRFVVRAFAQPGAQEWWQLSRTLYVGQSRHYVDQLVEMARETQSNLVTPNDA